jgi:hypothetical protein
MSQEQNKPVIKNYTATTLLSFSIMFILFVALSNCHGTYHPVTEHGTSAEHTPSEHHK